MTVCYDTVAELQAMTDAERYNWIGERAGNRDAEDTWAEFKHQQSIDGLRRVLDASMAEALAAVRVAMDARATLAGDEYDVEHAEGAQGRVVDDCLHDAERFLILADLANPTRAVAGKES